MGPSQYEVDCLKITHAMISAMLTARHNGVRVRFTEDYAGIMLAAVAPLILEKAAQVADSVMEARAKGNPFVEPGFAIRALITEVET